MDGLTLTDLQDWLGCTQSQVIAAERNPVLLSHAVLSFACRFCRCVF